MYEVKKVREYIRVGILHEYVEMRVRASSFLTAVLRFLDTESEYFERRIPVARKHVMKVNTMEHWDAGERAWVASCLRAYLDRNGDNYDMVVAHLRGAYKEICATVAEELGMRSYSRARRTRRSTQKGLSNV